MITVDQTMAEMGLLVEAVRRHITHETALRAIEALARIYPLCVGTVEVNIADRQINVAQ